LSREPLATPLIHEKGSRGASSRSTTHEYPAKLIRGVVNREGGYREGGSRKEWAEIPKIGPLPIRPNRGAPP